MQSLQTMKRESSIKRINASPEYKKDDSISKLSDDLLSIEKSSDNSSLAHSTFSGVTKQTTTTASTSLTSQSSIRSFSNLSGRARRRKPDKSACLRFKAFKPKADVPPLDFGSAGLVGRDKEISTLKSCYKRLSGNKKEFSLVAGHSGSGKSSVVRSLKKQISVEGLFVEGKFDMNTSNEPYSGVTRAFGTICKEIKEAGSDAISDLRQELTKELGEKTNGFLLQLIPELQDILVVQTSDPAVGAIDRVDETEGGVDRLRFAFRVLTRVFSSLFSPLVFFLDDLQWADVSSLQVLEYLISDTQNENPLMIIGSYRSEDVDENSLLYNKMVGLREKSDKFHFHMTELKIQPFRACDIEKVITAVLPCLRADHIAGLAVLCHKRTLGNPFFTIEFLKMLHFEGMLAFDKTTKTWSWNLSEIRQETMSTANVVAMIERQLRKLPEQVQALLQCAAYLGSAFSEATIDLVWSVYGRRLVDTRTQPVSVLLPILVADNVFERGEHNQYRWCHDKLQEAALSLSGTLRDTFQLDIGKTLYYGLTEEQVETDLFAIVDLINHGNVLKRREFAGVNLRAAEKAREISAFQAAAEYAAEGIRLLQDIDWSDNKARALSLYTIGAESELILGNVDAAERYWDAVLSRSSDVSALEMLPLQIGKAKALGDVELKSKEALEYCLKLLKKHGCRLSRVRSLALPQAVIKFILTMKKAKAMPSEFFETMEVSDDAKTNYIGYLLSKVAYNAYTAGDTAIYLLSTVKLVELTMEHGANETSASAFCILGVMSIIVLQDYESMERFQNIALGMLKKFQGMQACETIFVGHQLGLFWVKPIEIGPTVAEEAILAGRRAGNVVYTSWSIVLHVVYNPYLAGRPIHTILEDCPNTLAEFEEIKTTAHILAIKNYYQMLLNLSDPSCVNPSKNVGEIYSDTMDDHKKNLVHLADKIIADGELVFWHEDYEISAKHALKVGETYAKVAPGIYNGTIESFHRAVALYAAASKTKKRKYGSAANKIRNRISALAKSGNTTLQYYSIFLMAEHLAMMKKYKDAKAKYEEALEAVGELGHLHHLGLFNERYSDFLLRGLGLEKESRSRLEEAIRYYKEWGAIHKVKAVESRL